MAQARRLAVFPAAALCVLALAGCGGTAAPPEAEVGARLDDAGGVAATPGAPTASPSPSGSGTRREATRPPQVTAARPAPQPRQPERPVAGHSQVVIPKIGVDAPVVALGLNADRTMEVPTRRGLAGWYQYSPAPGATGPAIIAAHVHYNGAPDVFFRLSELEPGDEVQVRYLDGDVVTFTVYEVQQHPKDAFPTERVYGDTEGPELRLITCGGDFDRSQRSYRDNIIAFARIS